VLRRVALFPAPQREQVPVVLPAQRVRTTVTRTRRALAYVPARPAGIPLCPGRRTRVVAEVRWLRRLAPVPSVTPATPIRVPGKRTHTVETRCRKQFIPLPAAAGALLVLPPRRRVVSVERPRRLTRLLPLTIFRPVVVHPIKKTW